MSKVLCVDGDAALTDLLRYALTREGHSVHVAASGAEALAVVLAERPDLVLLDVTLPDSDGFALCAHLHTALHIPVIMLTVRKTDDEELSGFEHGADDYVTKPFTMQILMCRVAAVLRRTRPGPGPGPGPGLAPTQAARTLYHLGAGTFDAQTHEIAGPRGVVKVTRSEGNILRQLLAHRGQILSADQILDRAWDHATESNASVIKTHIRHIRQRIVEATGEPEVVETVRGLGYTVRASQSAPEQARAS